MRKHIIMFAAVLWAMFSGFGTVALGQSVHISKPVSDRIRVEADILVPENTQYASYYMIIPDLTQSDRYNENTLADLLFFDQTSPRTHEDERDSESRWGGNIVKNEAGEEIASGQTGTINYKHTSRSKRYSEPVNYVVHGIYGTTFFMYDVKFSADDLSKEHSYMSQDQADALCRDFIGRLGLKMGIRPIYRLAIGHEQMKMVYDELVTQTNFIEDGYFPEVSDWDDGDDLYAMTYGFSLDGLPIYDGLDVFQGRELSVASLHGFLQTPYIRAELALNPDGVYSMDIDRAGELGEAVEKKPVLGYEEAVACLEDHLGELIPPYSVEITSGYLQYVPVPSPQDFYTWTLIPTWCFNSDVLSSDEEGKVVRSPDVTYCFNAYTGEELQ